MICMNPFNQNFVEDISRNGVLRPGEYDFKSLMDVLEERPRFKETVGLIGSMRSSMSRRSVSDLFTHHYFIRSDSFNDGLASAVAIYYAIAEKYDYEIGDSIINRSDMRNWGMAANMNAMFTDQSCISWTDDEPSVYILNKTDKRIISDFDRCGIRIVFVIHSEDITGSENNSFFCNEEEAALHKSPDAKQIAAELGYTYVDIPADSSKQLSEYIGDFFRRSGFNTANVKKHIKALADLDIINDEYAATAAAKNILNRHIKASDEKPGLTASDFAEYIGNKDIGIRAGSLETDGKNRLIGLERERGELNNAVNGLLLNIKRQKAGAARVPMGCNLIFAGSPGTAKTTLARMFAKALAANRLIPSEDNFKECRKSDIIGKYVGFTASMIDEMFFEMHRRGGGVIFFDEIYSLSEKDSTCYDKEAINCITQNIENYRSTVYCIFAGYKNKMKGFINSNPGLSSRISATILFDDYSTDTLCRIFDSIARSEEFVIAGNYRRYLGKFFDDLREARGDNFGNGREARNLFEAAKRIMASRVIASEETSKEALSTINADEIKSAADTILASVIGDEEKHMQTIGF